MAKRIALLGSTGSIGRQALQVIQQLQYTVSALAAHSNDELLAEQVYSFTPEVVAMADAEAADRLSRRLAGMQNPPRVLAGTQAVAQLAAASRADIALNAIVGIAGLDTTLAALQAGIHVALANKESLVAGGQLVVDAAGESGAKLLPVDSEHSAIFQCLQDDFSAKSLQKILLTASGGPFYGYSTAQLQGVTRQQALHHPNWSMGPKITVDSATMMNKGLELIEAMWLFNVPPDAIEIVVQRESVIHSMVQFADHSVIAQLGLPDMRLPIQYALTWPRRLPGAAPAIDFQKLGSLHFGAPDEDTFRCLAACRQAARRGGLAPCAANGANEQAVALFLQDKIAFADIGRLVEGCLVANSYDGGYSLQDVYACDAEARSWVRQQAGR